MESLILLVPLSVALVLLIGWVFWRALAGGQFDDLEGEGMRVLTDDDTPGKSGIDQGNRGQTTEIGDRPRFPVALGNRGLSPISPDFRMRAMRLHQARTPLSLDTLAVPHPGPRQVLVKVRACGVCRTDLHLCDGELSGGRRPVIPGHEIVATVVAAGPGAGRYREGERIGIPWLGETCGECEYCRSGRENLCDRARFTGYDLDGGYAEYALADERFCFPIPARYGDEAAAPLLCAGLIGYRSLAMAGDARRLGIYGFGAAAHLVAQVARYQGRTVFAFTRPGDVTGQAFALQCGAHWAGDSGRPPPEPLDAAIVFAPVGALVPEALGRVRKGGTVVCGGIHMSDIPSFRYELLWGERVIRSVANLTRADAEQFMRVADELPLRTETNRYPLERANEALSDLRAGRLAGAAVLVP